MEQRQRRGRIPAPLRRHIAPGEPPAPIVSSCGDKGVCHVTRSFICYGMLLLGMLGGLGVSQGTAAGPGTLVATLCCVQQPAPGPSGVEGPPDTPQQRGRALQCCIPLLLLLWAVTRVCCDAEGGAVQLSASTATLCSAPVLRTAYTSTRTELPSPPAAPSPASAWKAAWPTTPSCPPPPAWRAQRASADSAGVRSSSPSASPRPSTIASTWSGVVHWGGSTMVGSEGGVRMRCEGCCLGQSGRMRYIPCVLWVSSVGVCQGGMNVRRPALCCTLQTQNTYMQGSYSMKCPGHPPVRSPLVVAGPGGGPCWWRTQQQERAGSPCC
jgi:hypothetical protein